MPATVISIENLIEVAKRESGAFGSMDDGLTTRLTTLIDWINARGPYTADQIDAMQRQLRRLLVTRLRIALDRQQYPGIQEEPIEKPIFIVGFARSGTTLLHSLLAEDPAVQAPQSWHVLAPSPPPGAGPVVQARIDFAQRAVEQWMDFCPGQRPLHPYVDKGAYQLIEDEEIFCVDLRNAYAYHLYKVPTLEPAISLGSTAREDFSFHRQMLQHLQWNTGRNRWVCKGPSAQSNLDALFEIYPDALCVWAHRPLNEIYGSLLTLSGIVYDTIQGKPGDWSRFAREYAEGMKAAFDNVMANALIDDPRVMHVDFKTMARNPLATVQEIYTRQGLAVTPEFQARMQAWLRDPENQVDRHGRYPYSDAALGIDGKWVEELFAPYSKRFGLEKQD